MNAPSENMKATMDEYACVTAGGHAGQVDAVMGSAMKSKSLVQNATFSATNSAGRHTTRRFFGIRRDGSGSATPPCQ
jgi:hypothetical protein